MHQSAVSNNYFDKIHPRTICILVVANVYFTLKVLRQVNHNSKKCGVKNRNTTFLSLPQITNYDINYLSLCETILSKTHISSIQI